MTITASLGAQVYVCEAHSPWQWGSDENANGLLRQYPPEGTDLTIWSAEHLRAVEAEVNARPRVVLDDQTPAELFGSMPASSNRSVLQR